MTTNVKLPALFQRYKTSLISYLHSFRVAMASRRRPPALTQPGEPTRRAPELHTWAYIEIVSPTFDPNRILLRRLSFLNHDKSKYVSVGFYPAHNYQPLVELWARIFYQWYSLTRRSQRWPKDCQVWWNQCARTNCISASRSTKCLEWIPQVRTGLPKWSSINTRSLSNCMNFELYCTYFTWSGIKCLCTPWHWAMFKLT